MPKKESVDTANLEKSLKELELKYGRLGRFKIIFLGILIGITISALIQLLILPLSFDTDNTLRFGNIILSRNVDPVVYSVSMLAIFMLVIVGIVYLYKTFVIGITPRKTAELTYKGDHKKIHDKLKEVLHKRCLTLDVKLKAPNDQEIFCYRGDPEEYSKNYLLKIAFHPHLKNILKITFRPENEDSMALIDEIRELYR